MQKPALQSQTAEGVGGRASGQREEPGERPGLGTRGTYQKPAWMYVDVCVSVGTRGMDEAVKAGCVNGAEEAGHHATV